jgi:hypothetical protein
MQDQYRRAQAQQQTTTPRPTSGSKPFDKSKLYSNHALKKDEEATAMLKADKKRKREQSRGSNSIQSHDAIPDPRPKMNLPQRSNSNQSHNPVPEPQRMNLSHGSARNTISSQAPSSHKKNAATPKIDDDILEKLRKHKESGGYGSSQYTFASSSVNTKAPTVEKEQVETSPEYEPPSARVSPPAEQPTTSPEYEPPPAGITIPVAVETDDVLSPGSQITQEFRATVQQPFNKLLPTSASQPSVMDQINSLHIEGGQESDRRPSQPGIIAGHDKVEAVVCGAGQIELDGKGNQGVSVVTDNDSENASSEGGSPTSDDMNPEAKAKAAKAAMNKRKRENAKLNKKEEAAKKLEDEARELRLLKTMSTPKDTFFLSRNPKTNLTSMKKATKISYEDTRAESAPGAPAMTSVSSSTTPDADILMQEGTSALLEDDDSHVPPAVPGSVEAKRRAKAANYDGTALDSFLRDQSAFKPLYQPTGEELEKTQQWGHIDPRKQWPNRITDEYIAAKMVEIKARGGKKANYGILLTAQVRKERKDNGWHIHQNKDFVPDEKSDLGLKHLEELFGQKNLDDLVPAVKDGRLVMMENPVDSNGKKKRKPKVYSVGY